MHPIQRLSVKKFHGESLSAIPIVSDLGAAQAEADFAPATLSAIYCATHPPSTGSATPVT